MLLSGRRFRRRHKNPLDLIEAIEMEGIPMDASAHQLAAVEALFSNMKDVRCQRGSSYWRYILVNGSSILVTNCKASSPPNLPDYVRNHLRMAEHATCDGLHWFHLASNRDAVKSSGFTIEALAKYMTVLDHPKIHLTDSPLAL